MSRNILITWLYAALWVGALCADDGRSFYQKELANSADECASQAVPLRVESLLSEKSLYTRVRSCCVEFWDDLRQVNSVCDQQLLTQFNEQAVDTLVELYRRIAELVELQQSKDRFSLDDIGYLSGLLDCIGREHAALGVSTETFVCNKVLLATARQMLEATLP